MTNTGQLPLRLEAMAAHAILNVEECLRFHHQGQQNAIKSKDLTVVVFGQYSHNYERAIQKAITTINQNGGVICSNSSSGYWWADSLADGLPAASRRVSRALHQLKNARTLKENLQRYFGGQKEMKP
jgi:hypothetical protein